MGRMIRGTNEGGFENQVLGSSPTAKWSKGNAPTPPAPAPGPGPAPFPPTPGSNCYIHGGLDQNTCAATRDLGRQCKWCPNGPISGICVEPIDNCPPAPPTPAP